MASSVSVSFPKAKPVPPPAWPWLLDKQSHAFAVPDRSIRTRPGPRRTGRGGLQHSRQRINGPDVALRSETHDDACRGVGNIRVVPIAFPLMNVAEMHFNDRAIERLESVQDRYGRGGEAGGIDHE